jgi:hypothetical protein
VIPTDNCGTGCPTPGIISATSVETYGTILHSVVDVYVPGAVPKSQLIPYPLSPGTAAVIVLLKFVFDVIRDEIVPYHAASYPDRCLPDT